MYDRDLFARVAEPYGVAVTPELAERLGIYARLLVEWNEKMNLTAITDPVGIAVKHFADSLTVAPLLPKGEFSLIDVGTGAGFPGVPLALYRPDCKLTLLDSLNKRIDFLKEVCDDLGLTDVDCVHGRAEEFAAAHRESYDIVTSRAVANLQMLCELCLPLVKEGGYFLSMKAVDSDAELKLAYTAIKTLGGVVEQVKDYQIPGTEVSHRLIYIKKVKETPKKYPRAFAKIKKNPL